MPLLVPRSIYISILEEELLAPANIFEGSYPARDTDFT